MKKLIVGAGLLIALSCNALQAKQSFNYSNNQSNNHSQSETDHIAEYTQAQLDQMLAPIALYPDSLLTHILIASTYPIEVVAADRWITKNKALSARKISKRLEDKDWEPSIKALIMFPNVLERLSNDLSWTQQLGDAFLQSEENVLSAIQSLRYKAEKAGSLDKMKHVKVSRDDNNIVIQPVQKEVVYVPYYDTRRVYGNWHWALNPPVYWDWGHRVSYSPHRPFGWHHGIHISLNYFFSDFHWNNRNVVVINHRNTHQYRSKKHIVRGGYANRWAHKTHHRRGVSYRNKYLNKRFNSHRPVVYKTVNQIKNKHHNGPKLYSQNKEYRANENRTKHNVKHSVKRVKQHNRLAKHEVLHNKFKTQKASKTKVQHKPNRAFKAKNNKIIRNNNLVKNKVVRKKSEHKQAYKPRKVVTQKKTYTNKKEGNRKNITVQRRTEKAYVKPARRTQKVKQNSVVKRNVTVQRKPNTQRKQRTETRRTKSNKQQYANRQSNRQERHKR